MDLKGYTSLKSAKHVWIYGAGTIGKQALELFHILAFGLPIEGFVVSDKAENPATVCGYQVHDINEISVESGSTVFIVAVSRKYQEEVAGTLARRGYRNYLLWDRKSLWDVWMLADYTFVNRSRGRDKACFVLSGYKNFLWENVFARLKKFVPEDVDICILSSGLWDGRLAEIAEINGWSYLSTKINDITLIQNVAARLFAQAKWIYKMDEDIFLTEGCFGRLYDMYHYVQERGHYRVGFVAPLIPVNGYGHIRILDYLGKLEMYESQFEKAVYGGFSESRLEKDPSAAAFMWGYQKIMPHLDDLNRILEKNNTFSVCGVRFSIGFIMFHRLLWEGMGGFPVFGKKDLGVDEAEICRYCIQHSQAIVVAENTAVGHFSFRQQTEGMKKFYGEHKELFEIKE